MSISHIFCLFRWVAFSSRTDVVAPELPDQEEEDDEVSEEDDEDEDFEAGEDEAEEEEKLALLNLILGEVLKKFRAENGRGPDSEELLQLRRQVAEKLGIHLDEAAVADAGKREAEDDGKGHEPSPKRVKFTSEDEAAGGDEGDSKPAAHADNGDGDQKPAAV